MLGPRLAHATRHRHLSLPSRALVHGQALNITVNGYVDGLDFGLMAAANVVPNVEPLTKMLTDELDDLEHAYGLAA